MENSNKKIISLSFLIASALIGLSISLLIKSFSGAFSIVARAAGNDVFKHGLPVAVGLILFLALQFNPKVLAWADEVVTEIKKIVWPSQKDTIAMTIVVCIMVVISSIIITSFDFMSGYAINLMIK